MRVFTAKPVGPQEGVDTGPTTAYVSLVILCRQLLALTAASLLLSGVGLADMVIGTCPRPGIERFVAGPFVQSDIHDVLAVEVVGSFPADRQPGLPCHEPEIARLSLFRLLGGEIREVWRSRPLLTSAAPDERPVPAAWTVMDLNGDGRLELLVFMADHCQVTSFGPDSIVTRELSLPRTWIIAAVAADMDDNGLDELVTIEAVLTDSLVIQVYSVSDSALVPISVPVRVPEPDPDIGYLLTGSGRVEGYYGRLPVIAGIRRETPRRAGLCLPGPAVLKLFYQDDSGEYFLTSNPFPTGERFSRDEPLPGGRLVLTNQGDTLIAFGYFVPGSRPGGPPVSFAALYDGAWQVLEIADKARNIGWPAYPSHYQGRPGWLELRDDRFRFHPAPVFKW